MSEHMHTSLVEGCYRCDLNRDEVEAAQRDHINELAADAGYAWGVINEHGEEGWIKQ